MDEVRLDYCTKCLDDHEDRLRVIEKNNKMSMEIKTLEQRVFLKFESNEKLYNNRLDSLERFVNSQLAVVSHQKEERHDTLSILAIIVSTVSMILVLLKFLTS